VTRKGERKFLIVIAGPTASGKTALAIKLAKHYNTVILSADSRQFYRELTIGTAKPSEEELKEVPHYFINNKSVEELYGAGHYEKDAIKELDEIFKTKDLVIVAGGSGLYIDALLNGVDDFVEIPPEIRENLNQEYAEKGLKPLQEELRLKDPHYYAAVDNSNPQRIIRALEVIRYSGEKFSDQRKKNRPHRNFIPLKILLTLPREQLYERINNRVDQMMRDGLLEEVRGLLEKKKFNALKTVGYRELYEYLEGRASESEAVNAIKQHTRNYAKRQLTWFRNKDQFKEFAPDELERMITYIDKMRE
jgi:tRNA dimethylallyltransferase